MTGTVYLVGAGPGDPELLTVRAHRLLQTADVVVHDRLVAKEILAIVPPQTMLIDVGKRPGDRTDTQSVINETLETLAHEHKAVVRLKGGDPLLFGRGAEEAQHLTEAGIAVEIVPGISSALGVPTAAGVPVTFRGMAGGVAVVTGHRSEETQAWAKYAEVDTLVILMGVANRAAIATALVAVGRPADEPTVFIERGTTPTERRVYATLKEVSSGSVVVESPAVWVVGAVAAPAQSRQQSTAPHQANVIPTSKY